MQSQRFQNLAHLEANINFFLQTASTKTHILLIAFSISFVRVLTRTRWSNPCASAMVSVMRQWSKNFCVAPSSTNTTSPMEKFLRILFHFCCSCNIGRYSVTHLFQNKSTIYWGFLDHIWKYRSYFLNKPGSTGLPFN